LHPEVDVQEGKDDVTGLRRFPLLCPFTFVIAAHEAVAVTPGPEPVGAADLRVGTLKANKILFLGNSITFAKHDPHGPWPYDCGVAASAPEKDYAHLVTRYIAEANGGRAPAMKAIADAMFEAMQVRGGLKAAAKRAAPITEENIREAARRLGEYLGCWSSHNPVPLNSLGPWYPENEPHGMPVSRRGVMNPTRTASAAGRSASACPSDRLTARTWNGTSPRRAT